MSGYSWIEIAIMLFIIGAIGLVVWKGGQANPEGTGTLGKQINRLDKDVGGLGKRLGAVEKDLERLDRDAATKADIQRLERSVVEADGKIDELIKLVAAQTSAADLRGRQLDMLYQTIVAKGMQQ